MLNIRLDVLGDELDLHQFRDVCGHQNSGAFVHFVRKGTTLESDPIYASTTNRWRIEEYVENNCPIEGLKKARMLYRWLPDEMERVWNTNVHISLKMTATGMHAYRAAKKIMENTHEFHNELHAMTQLCDVDIHLSKPPETGHLFIGKGQNPPVDAFMKFGDITHKNMF
jgi:hypothetical protein